MHIESNTTDADQEHTAQAAAQKPAVGLDMKALFSSQALERKKTSSQWHNQTSTAHHEKRIGMAPRGTRRSMGKR